MASKYKRIIAAFVSLSFAGTSCFRACSSVGLERTPDKREVGSSNLPRPTNSSGYVFGGPGIWFVRARCVAPARDGAHQLLQSG